MGRTNLLDSWFTKRDRFYREQVPKIESYIVRNRFGIYALVYSLYIILVTWNFPEPVNKTNWLEYLISVFILPLVIGPFILVDEIRARRKRSV